MSSRLTVRKRRARVGPAEDAGDAEAVDNVLVELSELRVWRDSLLKPVEAAGAYDLRSHAEKVQLARRLWSGDYLQSMTMLREANPTLVQVLSAQVASQYDRRAGPDHAVVKARQVDGMLLCAVRTQSQFTMPVVSAALSVLAECNQVPREFHLAMRAFFHGAVATHTWVDGFLTLARDLRPPPSYEVLPGVGVAVFDNLSMKLNYGAYVREGGGEYKTMTNWFHCAIPREFAPPGFDADEIFKQGIFRRDRSKSQFCRSFYLDCADVAHNRSHRWTKWLAAIRDGTFLQRPRVKPLWKPHKVYQPPIFDRLQSSYEDVEFELRMMRNELSHCRFLFAAGDGLTLMRERTTCSRRSQTSTLIQHPSSSPFKGSIPMASSMPCTVNGGCTSGSSCGVRPCWITSRSKTIRTFRISTFHAFSCSTF